MIPSSHHNVCFFFELFIIFNSYLLSSSSSLSLFCYSLIVLFTYYYYCALVPRTQPLICVGCFVHYWVSCAINKGGFIEIAFVVVVDTHLPRFEALAYVLPHFDALTHVVIRVSSVFIFQTFAEVCYKSVLNLRKAYIFNSFLKVYLPFRKF